MILGGFELLSILGISCTLKFKEVISPEMQFYVAGGLS